jgi:hypothetical protein
MKREDKENIDLEDLSGGDFWKCGCGKYHHITDVVCPKIKKEEEQSHKGEKV